jgi:hypothetical protein
MFSYAMETASVSSIETTLRFVATTRSEIIAINFTLQKTFHYETN